MILKKITWIAWYPLFFYFFLCLSYSFAQQEAIEKDQYIMSEEKDKKLRILVHIWGEVNRPGEYLVPDGTSVLELISKAGGPTEYSNLNNIKLSRGELGSASLKHLSKDNEDISLQKINLYEKYSERVIKISLKKHLENKNYESLPILQPGDTVIVSRNKWHKLQTMIRIFSQLAIIAQAWYYYSQIDN